MSSTGTSVRSRFRDLVAIDQFAGCRHDVASAVCYLCTSGSTFVMPGLDPGIHAFIAVDQEKRGWPEQACHDVSWDAMCL
jgi:hypothetical protein